MRVAVHLLRSFDRNSAIGRDVIEIDAVLRGAGFDTHVVCARSADPAAQPLAAFRSLVGPRTLVVYQHANGWPAGVRAFRRSPGIKCLRYQNVTPWRHFLGHHPGYLAATWLGARQTRRLARAPDIACFLPNSEFTARDLAHRTARGRCVVVDPLDAIRRVDPEAATVRALSDGALNLLWVGRLLPHKGVHHLIRALAVWKAEFPEPVRLSVVGATAPRLARYARALRLLADRLGVSGSIRWAGEVSASQLEAHYATASVLCVASHHEGFCMPIVEAMRRGVPVVAVATGAIPETAGRGALLLADHDPEALAAAARRAARDPELRARLRHDAEVQLRERHDPATQRRNLLAAIEELFH